MTNLAKFMRDGMKLGPMDTPLVYNPYDPFDILVRNFFDTGSMFAPANQTNIKYPVDIYEDEKILIFEIAAVGLDKKDITIEVDNNILRVSYNKEEDDEENKRHFFQRSIAKRAFSYGWKLSEKFNLTEISATMDKGILKIQIPLAEEKEKIKNIIKIK